MSLRSLLGRREVAFLLVGGFNTVFGLALFATFDTLLNRRAGYMAALAATYAVAIPVAFALQRRLVFRVHGELLRDFVRFTTVQLGAVGLNAALLPLLVELVHVPVLPAQILSLVAVVALTYVGHLSFSFRRVAAPAETDPGRQPEPIPPVSAS